MKYHQTINHPSLTLFNQNQCIIEKVFNDTLDEKISLERDYDAHLERITTLQQQIEREEQLLKNCLKKLSAIEDSSKPNQTP